jgi:hypothetical protein
MSINKIYLLSSIFPNLNILMFFVMDVIMSDFSSIILMLIYRFNHINDISFLVKSIYFLIIEFKTIIL